MLIDFDSQRELYLVFMNTNYPFDYLLKDGFKHVYLIERQAIGWVCLDPSQSDLHTYILPASYEADVMGEFSKRHPDFNILKLMVKAHAKILYPKLGVISCVSVMQYIIGVYWPFVFTPYQLYNKLLKKTVDHIEVTQWPQEKLTEQKEKRKPQQPKHSK
jgi:hypothetical protein